MATNVKLFHLILWTYFYVTIFIQAKQPVRIDREAYEGPVVEAKVNSFVEAAPAQHRNKIDSVVMGDDQTAEFHSRPPTRGGGRNLQDSSFSFSGS